MPESLFSAFTPNSYQEWLDKVNKDLRGKPLESLDSFTADGLRIHPLYTSDFPRQTISDQPKPKDGAWVVMEELIVLDEEEANKDALDKLNRGANGLLFYVYANVKLDVLLENILLEHITTHFVVEGNAKLVLEQWVKIVKERGLNFEQVKGSINIDPIENAARTGSWWRDSEADMLTLKEIILDAPRGIKTLCVNANLYGNAGATPGQQLGLAIAHIFEYVNRFGVKYIPATWLNFAIGSQYFVEISKFRAMRRLWQYLLEQLNVEAIPLTIYAEAGFRNKTIYDPWVNMLRSTTEAMSAAVGGVDEILVRPFNTTYKVPQEFGNRVARNQQLILAYESYFNRVNDASAGSYFIENLTEELAYEGWEFFKKIEKRGGLIQALESGWIQKKIGKAARMEEMRFNAGKLPLLGSNLYPNKLEKMKPELEEPLFSSIPQNTQIEPIVAKRLSEELELKRLVEEGMEG